MLARFSTATVTATAHNGISANCIVTVETETNVEDNQNIGVNIFPNPFTGDIRVVMTETFRTASIRIIDAAGAVLHTQTLTNADETLNLGHLPAGVYLFLMEIDGKSKTVRVVKQ